MKKFLLFFYIFLWVIYGLQGTLYPHGNYLSVGSLALSMALSLYYYVYANLHYKLPTPMKILSFLLLIWTIYGMIPILFGTGQTAFQIQPFSYLKGIYMSLLPIYAFYVFARQDLLTEDRLRFFTIVFFLVAIASFYDYQRMALLMVENNREEVTNNAGYVFASLIPLIPVYWRKPLLQYVLLGVCMLFVLIGMKRGAIIGGVISSVWLLLESFRQKNIEGKRDRRSYWRLLGTIAIVIGAVYAVQYMINTSDYFNQRITLTLEGDYSGREIMYGSYFNWYINQSNVFNQLFGNGADATLRFFTDYAHNDWIEMLIDNGLIATVLYAIYWVSLLVMLWKGARGSTTTMMLGCFIFIYLLKSFFSMSYNGVTEYAACALGYALVNYEYKSTNRKLR